MLGGLTSESGRKENEEAKAPGSVIDCSPFSSYVPTKASNQPRVYPITHYKTDAKRRGGCEFSFDLFPAKGGNARAPASPLASSCVRAASLFPPGLTSLFLDSKNAYAPWFALISADLRQRQVHCLWNQGRPHQGDREARRNAYSPPRSLSTRARLRLLFQDQRRPGQHRR